MESWSRIGAAFSRPGNGSRQRRFGSSPAGYQLAARKRWRDQCPPIPGRHWAPGVDRCSKGEEAMTIVRRTNAQAKTVLLVGLTILAAGCASTKVSETPPTGVDLSGTWLLNQELSADTEGAIEHAMTQARRSGSNAGERGGARGGKGGGGPGAGAGGSGGQRGSRSESQGQGQGRGSRERLDVLVAELSPSTDQVTIEQTASELIVVYGTQWEYRHQFGQELTLSVAGIDGERLSGWQEQQYVVETKTENGSTVTEYFRLAPDDNQLQITLTLEAKRLPDPISVTRVYDRVADSTAAAEEGA